MKVIEEDVWTVKANSDTTEGRGSDIHVGYFKRKTDAIKAGVGRGVMGTDLREPYSIKQEKVRLIVYDNYTEFEEEETRSLRDRALSKLTYEEKKALGLV